MSNESVANLLLAALRSCGLDYKIARRFEADPETEEPVEYWLDLRKGSQPDRIFVQFHENGTLFVREPGGFNITDTPDRVGDIARAIARNHPAARRSDMGAFGFKNLEARSLPRDPDAE